MELNANDLIVNSKIDTNEVLIGDQIKLTLSVSSKKITKIQFPDLTNNLKGLELIEKSKIDTLKSDTLFKLSAQYIITSFDSGQYQIPSLSFTSLNDFKKETLYTEPIYLTFHTLEVDTTKEIKDIKPPLEIGADWIQILIYLLIAIIILTIAYFVYRYYLKKKSTQPNKHKQWDESILPHTEALNRLKELETKKLWQSGFYKEYFTELTDILRTYMERQFKIDALEMTSSEIIISLKTKRLSDEIIEKMKYLFENADLSKFAKYKPLPEININSLDYAYYFIDATKTPNNHSNQQVNQNNKGVGENE